ncbi:MAG: 2,3-bisphosphoglycerate-dependent phosphoglycerate mutase [Gammaproteobacteria bacterium]|nr:2,3-bisphosphoglycerate-dependent phosphoglycerate mutase [Gammaproteobacteria bacterium]
MHPVSYPHVVLVRHAQSEWNREGRFTGWADPPLTAQGVAEARAAGRRLAAAGHRFDRGFASRLGRARHTLELMLGELGQPALPVTGDWRLNERHYGALQGRFREEEAARLGTAQVLRWRRGYADLPPLLPADDPRHPARDPRYRDVPRDRLPAGESLALTRRRVAAFWREAVAPRLRAGERMLVASHGNTLRALLMELEGMGVAEVESFEIPTGQPILYAFDAKARPMGWCYLPEATQPSAA